MQAQNKRYKTTGNRGLFDEQEKVIDKYKMNNKVHEKGYRNKPLTDEQKANLICDNLKKLNTLVLIYGNRLTGSAISLKSQVKK